MIFDSGPASDMYVVLIDMLCISLTKFLTEVCSFSFVGHLMY